MTKTAFHIFLWAGLLCSLKSSAQQPYYTYFTIRDGLPSNDIYNCVEDKKGFLWIATENGVSKFEGKTFKNYFVEQGLPDNEVLMVQVDKEGIVWVLPFQRTPSYYDEKADRFINSGTDKELSKIKFTSITNSTPLSRGGMAFCNSDGGLFIYKNKKCETFSGVPNGQKRIGLTVYEPAPEKYVLVSTDSLRFISEGKVVRKEFLGVSLGRTAVLNNCVYLTDQKSLIKIPINADGTTGTKMKNEFPFVIAGMNFTGKELAVTSANGNIYLTDTATLGVNQQGFSFKSLIRFVYEDSKGNNWICAKEIGLVRYQQKGILSLNNPLFQRNFNTLTFSNNGLVAGTNDGNIYFYRNPYDYNVLRLSDEQDFLHWVRKIKSSKNSILVAEEGGFFKINDDMSVKQLSSKLHSNINKTFIPVNDTIIIGGSSTAIRKLNMNTAEIMASVLLRVIALEQISPEIIYAGSNTGLYRWKDFGKLENIGLKYPLLTTRINTLSYNTCK